MNLLKILFDIAYLFEFYLKLFKIWWTDRLKVALMVYQILLEFVHRKIICARILLASAFGAKN